jgi:hypothetical protein
MMKRAFVAGTVALMLAGSGLALAQPAVRGASMQRNAEDPAAFSDARVAALKAGLKLTPEQEKNWPAVETTLRELAKQRADRAQARDERRGNAGAGHSPDAITRLRHSADAMEARAAGLKKLADASEPLYSSLDDAQKRRFTALLRTGDRAGMGRHMKRTDTAH